MPLQKIIGWSIIAASSIYGVVGQYAWGHWPWH